MPSQPTRSGIVTDESSGSREIPESMRSDGSTRKAIKIRPGYRPPEDVEVYKNRQAHAFHERGKRIGIPGATGLKEEKPEASSAASNKNAKRREARKKAKATEGGEDGEDAQSAETDKANVPEKTDPVDPEIERQKKGRNLKKKLKQARELQSKKEGGETLLPEQIAKVIKINELIRELDALGIDADEDAKPKDDDKSSDKV